jgi:hypothetical protein
MSQRRVSLEMDKVEGTEFPPESVDFENENHNLRDIFSDAGMVLEIRKDEKDIPNLAGGEDAAYTMAELDNLMKSRRNLQNGSGETMSAYLVVVNGLFFREDPQDWGPSTSTLGIMFDTERRLGTAIFYGQQDINTDARAFLRTSAHELGHQFNLHHDDATSYMQGGIRKYTIMNQTRIITRSSSRWPNGIGFRFGDLEKTHLMTHPLPNVQPGGSPFLVCAAEHDEWHTQYEQRLG